MMADLNLLGICSLIAVMMIGMPHGALDGAVAMAVGYGKRWQDITKFAVVYIAIAALVVAVWISAPIISLAVFMAVSMAHFGLGDHNRPERFQKVIQVICHGGLVVTVIPHAHHNEVMPIFMTLTGSSTISDLSILWQFLNVLGIVFIAASVLYAAMAYRHKMMRMRFAEFAGLIALMVVLPPLTGFALYFCAIHTIRHVRTITTTIKTHDSTSKILPLTAVFTILTWLIFALAFTFRPESLHFNDAIIQLVFISLAALTVPHMMLVDGVFRPKFLTPIHNQTGS